MNENRFLALILLSFVVLGMTYAIVTPVFEASDELWHYPMIHHLADGNPLPEQVFDPALAGPWNQEASQPPLYYYIGAALTFWIDRADMTTVRWLNPHVDNGVLTTDGNTNLAIHDTTLSPWQGTVLAVHLVRFFSVFLGAATVYLTFRIAKLTVPDRPEIVLGATAVNAFLPMFLFISGAVNNDNLAVPLASLALFLMVHQVVSRSGWRIATSLVLGIVMGLAILTKEGTFGLFPLAAGTIFIACWQMDSQYPKVQWRHLLTLLGRSLGYFFILLVPVLLIAGWWYYRNLVLYGDWLGWNAFIAVLGQRAHPASLAQLWGERWGFMLSYWGLFGGVNIPMWRWVYYVLNSILIVSVIGFVLYLLQEVKMWPVRWQGLESMLGAVFQWVERYFGLVVCLLFVTTVIVGLIQWATTTWSSQGRLVFTAISSLSVLMMLGLVGWLPRRAAIGVSTAVSMFMFTLAAVAPFVWIRPAYQPPPTMPALSQRLDVNFADKIRLVGYEINTMTVHPGEPIEVQLEWEVLAEMTRNWSVFVHLNDPVLERPIAQRDMYLGQGLLATSLLKPGQHLVNRYHLRLPSTAVAPADLELSVGLYDFYSGERLAITPEQSSVTVATMMLESLPGLYPNPILVNFEDELELVGYEISPRRVQPGDTVWLSLYWRTQRPLNDDYTFFAQVVADDTTRWGSLDLPQPTSSWPESEVQVIQMPLDLSQETPADLYPIIVGLYTRTEDGGFARLQIVTDDGRLTDDFLSITPIRVIR